MDNDKAKVLEKIRKLLALAKDSGAAENEAATAARQAASLMNKYQIESADVMIKSLDDPTQFTRDIAAPSPRKRAKPFEEVVDYVGVIAMGVAVLHDCIVDIVRIREGGVALRFSGHALDVPVAIWTQEMLTDTVYRLSQNDPRAALNRNMYRKGASNRLQARLYEMKNSQNQENQSTGTGTSLVVIEKKKAAVSDMFGEQKQRQTTALTDKKLSVEQMAAYLAGEVAGSKIQINAALETDKNKVLT